MVSRGSIGLLRRSPTRCTLAMTEPIRKRLAVAMANREFISVRTYSMYRLACADPQAPEHILSPDVDDDALGRAALNA